MSGFFQKYPLFSETSTVAAELDRLDFRYDHIIARNRAMIAGRRILDIASHDGRWTFAALKGAGATHVTGIEARAHLVEAARPVFDGYGIDRSAYDMRVGDVFDVLPTIEAGSVDTAMVLGFLYHTARQYDIFAQLARIGVKDIIVDCKVLNGVNQPYVLMKMENTTRDAMIWDKDRHEVLSSIPSVGALEMFLREFGYVSQVLAPEGTIPASAGVYARGRRVTMTGTRA